VTWAKVSFASDVNTQFVPSERHKLRPATVAVAKLAVMAKRLVEETVEAVIDEPKSVVAVASVKEAAAKVDVPVTVSGPVTTKASVEVPPLNTIEFVVVLPAFVTVWRFGVVPVGQLVPFWRQTFVPFTVRKEKAPFVEKRLVLDAIVAKEVVNVAFVAVRFWREAVPRTVSVEVTVEEAARNPPNNWSVAVADAPRLETWAKVSFASDVNTQFVPSERHKLRPATVAVAKLAVTAKRLVEETVEAVMDEAKIVVPVASLNETFWREVVPRTVSVEVTVEEAARNPP
jgi:hypothetical protein